MLLALFAHNTAAKAIQVQACRRYCELLKTLNSAQSFPNEILTVGKRVKADWSPRQRKETTLLDECTSKPSDYHNSKIDDRNFVEESELDAEYVINSKHILVNDVVKRDLSLLHQLPKKIGFRGQHKIFDTNADDVTFHKNKPGVNANEVKLQRKRWNNGGRNMRCPC